MLQTSITFVSMLVQMVHACVSHDLLMGHLGVQKSIVELQLWNCVHTFKCIYVPGNLYVLLRLPQLCRMLVFCPSPWDL